MKLDIQLYNHGEYTVEIACAPDNPSCSEKAVVSVKRKGKIIAVESFERAFSSKCENSFNAYSWALQQIKYDCRG